MKWICKVNNKHCVDGWVDTGTELKQCECVKLEAVHKSYHSWGRFNKQYFIELKDLETSNVARWKTSQLERYKTDQSVIDELTIIDYKKLANIIIDNRDTFLEKQAKFYIFGSPGTGKSQFVSTIAYELAKKEIDSYYLQASDLYDLKFDFSERGKEELRKVKDRINHPITKVLVIDDIGSELPKGNDNRIYELLTEYNNIIRNFLKKEHVMIFFTSNLTPHVFEQTFRDKRFLDVIFQKGITQYYEFSAKAKHRQKEEDDLFDELYQ